MLVYTSDSIFNLDSLTPTEGVGNSFIPELNDTIREIKRAIKTNIGITAKTGAYSLTVTDSVVLCNGTFTISLPQQVAVSSATISKKYTIVNTGTGIITISPYAGDSLAVTALTAGQTTTIVGNGGTAWRVVAGHIFPGNVSIGTVVNTFALSMGAPLDYGNWIGTNFGSNSEGDTKYHKAGIIFERNTGSSGDSARGKLHFATNNVNE